MLNPCVDYRVLIVVTALRFLLPLPLPFKNAYDVLEATKSQSSLIGGILPDPLILEIIKTIFNSFMSRI
jgi:hypothetical protein